MGSEVSVAKDPMVPYLIQLNWMHGFPPEERQFLLLCKLWGRFASLEQSDHPDLGQVVPAQWLIEQVATTQRFFPPPIEARRIYETYFPPVDGRSAQQLEDLEPA